MNLNKFTEKAQQGLMEAQDVATRLGHQSIDVEHLLTALLKQEGGLIPRLMEKSSISLELLLSKLEEHLEKQPKVSGGTNAMGGLHVSQRLNKLMTTAQDEAKRLKDEYVSVEHLVLPMFKEAANTGVAKAFDACGLNEQRFTDALQSVRGNQKVTSNNPEATYESLEKYGRDLTRMAQQNKLDPVIGRDNEIRRAIQVLSRRTKNNPDEDGVV
ncbi:MAG: Clp protease N-terminal domain-containing protein, partial [Verrucomicrobiota bacterium]